MSSFYTASKLQYQPPKIFIGTTAMIDVNKKIISLLSYNSSKNENLCFDAEYQSLFENEGFRKSAYIIEKLKSNTEISKENLTNFVYLCIGGSDGSEIESILYNTDIQNAILVEISDSSSEYARQRANKIQKETGKEMIVMQGDVTQRTDDMVNKMKELKKSKNIEGLVLSIQGVLHELPKRSPNFRAPVLFGQLFSVYNKNIFFGKEPIKPERWPDTVQLSIGNATSDNLVKIADLVNEKLSITTQSTKAVANGFIHINSTLALETLHKVIRSNSIKQFKYELEEQLTTIDPDLLIKWIENHIGKATVTIEPCITDGFIDEWKKHSVKVKMEDGTEISYPNTHARFIGISLPIKDSVKIIESKKRQSARIKKLEESRSAVKVIQKRSDIRTEYKNIIEGIKERFYVYGIGLGGFAEEYRTLIQKKIREGISIKILALSPREEIFKIFFRNAETSFSLLEWKDYESDKGEKSKKDSMYLQDWVFEENLKLIEEGLKYRIQLKFYSRLPVGAIMIADNTIFYSPALVSNSDENSTMVFETSNKTYTKFNRYFEELWANSRFSQTVISEYVLQHFCTNGCLIKDVRLRRRYKKDASTAMRTYNSLIDHAKEKLLYNELAPIFLQAASRNTNKEINFIRDMEIIRGEAIEVIVDLGCGVGRHSIPLSNWYTIKAIDISKKEIELASKLSSADFQVGDMRDWNTDKKADLIICMWSTFNYLSTQNDIYKFVESCRKNIDENGLVVIDIKNPEKLVEKNHSRSAFCYPYEIKVNIQKSIVNNELLNGIYTYEIKNLKTEHSIVATDQEINKIYTLDSIKESFAHAFELLEVFGDYSIDKKFSNSSERLILVFKIKRSVN